MLALRVSDLIGPSSGAFCTSCIRRLWCVVIRVLLYMPSRYKFVGRTAYILQDDTRSLQYQAEQILVSQAETFSKMLVMLHWTANRLCLRRTNKGQNLHK